MRNDVQPTCTLVRVGEKAFAGGGSAWDRLCALLPERVNLDELGGGGCCSIRLEIEPGVATAVATIAVPIELLL